MVKSATAVIVDKVYKNFKLPHQRKDTIKSVFTGMFEATGKRTTVEQQHALRDISFDIKKGEFFGIVGRNGSGKSTLLKILAGIYQPTQGKVMVEGKLVPFIELGVGFNPELTGRQNVYLNGALLGFSKTEVEKMYDDIVEFAEIERFMDQKLKNYSSGMQVRLAFSMAIRAEADVLLIDEVLAVGDADFQRKCFRYFKKLKKDRKTVVFVSHDMNAVREYCDRAAFIEKSNLIAVDTPEKISKMYEKMLAPAAAGVERSTNNKRWGDGILKVKKAEIVEIAEDKVSFAVTVEAYAECDDPLLGFVLKNDTDVAIMGTNTQLEKVKIRPLKKGEQVKLAWSFPNVFADGDHSITVAALYDNGVTTGDWWEEAITLRITRSVHAPFLIAPKINCTIEDKV